MFPYGDMRGVAALDVLLDALVLCSQSPKPEQQIRSPVVGAGVQRRGPRPASGPSPFLTKQPYQICRADFLYSTRRKYCRGKGGFRKAIKTRDTN